MAKPLTALGVSKARAGADRREIPDGGCSGLYLIVQPSGVKSWALRYRSRGRPVKFTLGSVLSPGAEPSTAPALDTPLSLAAARVLAAQTLREVQAGHDPAVAKRQRREQQHAAAADTFESVAEEFLRREGGRLRTLNQRRADLELLYPSLGRLPIPEIRRAQFAREFDRIEDQRGAARANRVQTATKALLNWFSERSDHVSVLTRTKARISISEHARSRVLSDDELRKIWLAAERDGTQFGAYLQFLLLTAVRRSEAGGLRRSELIDGGRSWLIPAARYKSKRDTLVPLSRAAQKIIAEQPDGDYVFGFGGARPLNDFAARKTAFDRACGITGWRIHDVRRTARTLLSRAGVSVDVAEQCLGHTIGGLRGTYDRYQYRDEKARAFESLAALVERIIHPSPTVVPISRAKSARRK